MKNKKRTVWYIAASVCAIGFCICIVWLLFYYRDLLQAGHQMENLEGYVVNAADSRSVSQSALSDNAVSDDEIPEDNDGAGKDYPDLEGYDVPEIAIDFDALRGENEDIYAWIVVPGTSINNPVLQHPEDPVYYLEHNLDGSRGYPGCIYTELYNSKEWDDPNTVLYGHNMKDGSMFAGLHHFEDPEFFEKYQYIYIFTNSQIYAYRIFAAYEFTNAHLILSFNLDDPKCFQEYLDGIFQRDGINQNFREGMELTAEDRIITLATCIGGKPDKRYLVQGVLTAIG